MKKIRSALISLSDKSNLKPLLEELTRNNIKIISSGGTFKEILCVRKIIGKSVLLMMDI